MVGVMNAPLTYTSPVAILATLTAAPITSAGRFSPFGPLGTLNHLLFFAAHRTDIQSAAKAIRGPQRTGDLPNLFSLLAKL